MVIELSVFVFRPVFNEMRAWYQFKDKIHWNKSSIRFSAFIFMLFVLLAIPWQQHIERAAVLRPAIYTQLYSPEAARIKSIHIERGMKISKGDVLFELESPELDAQYKKAAIQVKTLQWQLERNLSVQSLIGLSDLSQQRYAEALTVLRSINAQRNALRIVSPMDGRVLGIDESLHLGRWVNNTTALVFVGDDGEGRIETYVPEEFVTRIHRDDARFYSNGDLVKPFDVEVISIDKASTLTLSDPWLASIYGGDVAVTQNPDGTMVSHESVYRVRLKPIEETHGLPHLLRGTVLISVGSESILARIWKFTVSVVLRESGF